MEATQPKEIPAPKLAHIPEAITLLARDNMTDESWYGSGYNNMAEYVLNSGEMKASYHIAK